MIDFLKRLLQDEEGYNPEAHIVKGKMHIGYGHCLDQEQSEEELAVMQLDDELEDWTGFKLSDEQCDALFEIDVQDAIDDLAPVFMPPDIEALGDTRGSILLSMCFQMGGAGVRKFKAFLQALKDGDWERAADEMEWSNGLKKQRRSAWYKQTQIRFTAAANAMRKGYFDRYQEKPIEQRPEQVDRPLAGATDEELIDEIRYRFNRKKKEL
ncbi:MAG: glycoside hydrolase family protein [Candidatus Poribacteria bacterium]|nr:glycoside hydrolase family protein [Candidatus Poribacteria bacterium]